MARRASKRQIVNEIRSLLRDRTDPDIRAAYEWAAIDLEEHIKRQYIVKSNGGTDDIGQRWEHTKAFAADGTPMMYRTGGLFDSIEVRVVERPSPDGGIAFDLEIIADRDYAPYALGNRPAWPAEGLPEKWGEVFLRSLRKRLAVIVQRRIAA